MLGASGYFGSAAVLLGLALGAARVVAVARNRDALDSLAVLSPRRIFPVALSGDIARDTEAIRRASDGAADLVLFQCRARERQQRVPTRRLSDCFAFGCPAIEGVLPRCYDIGFIFRIGTTLRRKPRCSRSPK